MYVWFYIEEIIKILSENFTEIIGSDNGMLQDGTWAVTCNESLWLKF